MVDRVGRIALAKEACADVLSQRELGVEDLDREALLIAMRSSIDDGHASDSEHAVEAVLAAEDGAHGTYAMKFVAVQHAGPSALRVMQRAKVQQRLAIRKRSKVLGRGARSRQAAAAGGRGCEVAFHLYDDRSAKWVEPKPRPPFFPASGWSSRH